MDKYLTKEGLEKLKKELDCLKTIKRKEIAQSLGETASFGDLTENAAYQGAKEDQAFLEGKILELENLIKEAILIEEKARDQIEVGSAVWLAKGWRKAKFKIVGTTEANLNLGKISTESPLGKALIGRRKGEIIEVEAPEGKIKYKIIKIA